MSFLAKVLPKICVRKVEVSFSAERAGLAWLSGSADVGEVESASRLNVLDQTLLQIKSPFTVDLDDLGWLIENGA